jgi:hypothetical protein
LTISGSHSCCDRQSKGPERTLAADIFRKVAPTKLIEWDSAACSLRDSFPELFGNPLTVCNEGTSAGSRGFRDIDPVVRDTC